MTRAMKSIYTAVIFVTTTFLNLAVADEYFKGFQCKMDCSGHKAGYEWAESQGIYSEDTCHNIDANGSSSFLEGCIAYAREH